MSRFLRISAVLITVCFAAIVLTGHTEAAKWWLWVVVILLGIKGILARCETTLDKTHIKQSFGFAGTDRKYCHSCGQLMTAENKMNGINAAGNRSEDYCQICNNSTKP